ncbi:MAG: uracil-DNA glycosylase [Candidatus Sulfotelmatobacter sp.]
MRNSQDAPAQSKDLNTNTPHWLTVLNREVIACTRCPRLVAYREQIAHEKRRAYRDHEYWGKPVPGFGDSEARVLVMGLAPGAHGSNRTGRPFTGDASGKFMFPVLYETNKPTPQELANCSHFLDREMAGLEKVKVVVALGKIGFDAYLNYMKRLAHPSAKNAEEWGTRFSRKNYAFKHGASYRLPDGKMLLASYHPSNQNTQTGKLTREMFVKIFKQAARLADE